MSHHSSKLHDHHHTLLENVLSFLTSHEIVRYSIISKEVTRLFESVPSLWRLAVRVSPIEFTSWHDQNIDINRQYCLNLLKLIRQCRDMHSNTILASTLRTYSNVRGVAIAVFNGIEANLGKNDLSNDDPKYHAHTCGIHTVLLTDLNNFLTDEKRSFHCLTALYYSVYPFSNNLLTHPEYMKWGHYGLPHDDFASTISLAISTYRNKPDMMILIMRICTCLTLYPHSKLQFLHHGLHNTPIEIIVKYTDHYDSTCSIDLVDPCFHVVRNMLEARSIEIPTIEVRFYTAKNITKLKSLSRSLDVSQQRTRQDFMSSLSYM